MCTVMAALTGISTAIQLKGQQDAMNAQAEMANAQAEQDRINANIQAKRSEQIADQYAQKQRDLYNKMVLVQGQNTAQAGASGVSSTTGSAFDVMNAGQDAYVDDSRNLLDQQRNAVWGSHIDEYNFLSSANSHLREARNAKKSGRMAMLGTFLSGASSIYGNVNAYKKAKPITSVKSPYGFGEIGNPDVVNRFSVTKAK